jgi:hypothetical protein
MVDTRGTAPTKVATRRNADQITTFAGAMWFVHIHIPWFGLWLGLGAERAQSRSPRASFLEVATRPSAGSVPPEGA